MKSTVSVFNESAKKMVDYVNKQIKFGKKSLEAKNVSARYTSNNISVWGFGIQNDNFAEIPSEIFQLTNDLFELSYFQNLLLLITTVFPILRRFTNAR